MVSMAGCKELVGSVGQVSSERDPDSLTTLTTLTLYTVVYSAAEEVALRPSSEGTM